MSTREKNLLAFLGIALFVILSSVAFSSFYLPALRAAESEQQIAETRLKNAKIVLSQSEELEPEIQWLKRSGTTHSSPQEAQSKLQTLLRKQASARNLDIRNSGILPFQVGEHFTRVNVQFKVTGRERDVFSWLTSIHLPQQRQVVTRFEISPQSNDLTRIEVEVEIEKWIIIPEEV